MKLTYDVLKKYCPDLYAENGPPPGKPATPATPLTPATEEAKPTAKITPEMLDNLITPGMTYDEYQDKRSTLLAKVYS
jgi:hypothetical protein